MQEERSREAKTAFEESDPWKILPDVIDNPHYKNAKIPFHSKRCFTPRFEFDVGNDKTYPSQGTHKPACSGCYRGVPVAPLGLVVEYFYIRNMCW